MTLLRLSLPAFLLTVAISICSCNNSNNSGETSESADSSQTSASTDTSAAYLSVQLFVEGQIRALEDMPRAITRYHTENSTTDSGYISMDEFARMAAEFSQPDISSPSLKSLYRETSFVDQTLNMITFNYEPLNDTLELQRADILISEESVSHKISSVYLEKQIRTDSGMVYQKMYWKADSHFQITRSTPGANGVKEEKIRVVWKI